MNCTASYRARHRVVNIGMQGDFDGIEEPQLLEDRGRISALKLREPGAAHAPTGILGVIDCPPFSSIQPHRVDRRMFTLSACGLTDRA